MALDRDAGGWYVPRRVMKRAAESSRRARDTESAPGGETAKPAGRLTAFQRRVYDALREVPAGRVTTYGLLRGEGVCFDEAGRLAEPARLYHFGCDPH